MKDHIQTIINVCLAIFVATTIYIINELDERIGVLELQNYLEQSSGFRKD